MAKKLINFPAFPVPGYPGDAHNPAVRPNSGMGIREFFAAMAIQGMLANPDIDFSDKELAEEAFKIADAALLEREKQ